MADDKWRWRQGQGRGRYAPRLWPVWLVAPIWVVAAIALAGIIFLLLRAAASRPSDVLELVKTTITVAGFVGAVLVGVYGYRKQRLVEGDAHRTDAEQLAQRYTTAAEQLGHERAAVRLAGVYAMARLADDWVEQRQVCIDVLCAYLRMPYESDTASEKYREGEREVRHTIICLIRDHLRNPSAPTTWCGRDLDFTNAIFDGGNFDDAKFTGGEVSFLGAKFTGGEVSFSGAEFAGGTVVFGYAEFTGGTVFFSGAKFTGSVVTFYYATFIDGTVTFNLTEFTDSSVAFDHAKFAGSTIYFTNAKIVGGVVFFGGVEFTGGIVYFGAAEFVSGAVSFTRAELAGSKVYFDEAEFSIGCDITWGPLEPPAAWTELQENERRLASGPS